MNDEELTTTELIAKINQWRQDWINNINQNFAGRSLMSNEVAANMIWALVDDVKFILAFCESLAIKIKKLEQEGGKDE